MKHARADYDRIQDPAGLIPDDEPVFLLRAKDACAPATVLHWAAQAALRDAEPAIIDAATRQALLMSQWQIKHGAKVPDMPEGAGTLADANSNQGPHP